MSYTSVTISGYDSNPPPNDGSAGTNNQVKWATIKTKLFDPNETALSTIDDNAFSAITTADTTLATLQSSVSSLSSNVSAISTTLFSPSGTAMLFQQTSAPTGWAKSTAYDDYALRLVTGTPSTGGSTAFTDIFKARTVATANLPVHDHTWSQSSVSLDFSGGSSTFVYNVNDSNNNAQNGGSSRLQSVSDNTAALTATVSVSGTTGSSGSGGTWDFAVQYVDLIIATKS